MPYFPLRRKAPARFRQASARVIEKRLVLSWYKGLAGRVVHPSSQTQTTNTSEVMIALYAAG
jgi:hypothetical protein